MYTATTSEDVSLSLRLPVPSVRNVPAFPASLWACEEVLLPHKDVGWRRADPNNSLVEGGFVSSGPQNGSASDSVLNRALTR